MTELTPKQKEAMELLKANPKGVLLPATTGSSLMKRDLGVIYANRGDLVKATDVIPKGYGAFKLKS